MWRKDSLQEPRPVPSQSAAYSLPLHARASRFAHAPLTHRRRVSGGGRNETSLFEYAGYMDTRKSSALLLAILFALLVSFSEAAYSQPAPCILLTQNQVSSAVGENVGAGAPIANTGCSWKATGASKVVVTVSMQNAKMFAGAKSSNAPKMTKVPVSGVGDEAFFEGVQNFSSLWVKKGSAFVLVRIYGLPVSEAQTKLKTLATNVVSKL